MAFFARKSKLSGVVFFCILCLITLFVTSHLFVSEEITAKWIGLMLSIGIFGLVASLSIRKIALPFSLIDILLAVCFALFFFRAYFIDGIVSFFPLGLFLLYYLIRLSVAVYPPQYLFCTVLIFASALSIHGLLQLAGLIPSNNHFAITGSFDNPAGFAAALSCCLPFCFLFFKNPKKLFRYTAYGVAILLAVAVILSGSRAGMLAISIVIAIWVIIKLKLTKRIPQLSIAVIMIALTLVLYFLKKDSADGRLLIWRISSEMISDAPIFGHGAGAINAKYMQYQAEYFTANPDSPDIQLADNVLHPFNEYLLLLCEHGLIGLSVLLFTGFIVVRVFLRSRRSDNLPALLSLITLGVFSFFSYPFKYPFSWVILLMSIAIICNIPHNSVQENRHSALDSKSLSLLSRSTVLLLSIVLLTYSVIQAQAEIKWKRVAHLALCGQARKVLLEYDQLHRWLGKNGLFLYNHAAVLYEAGEFEKSVEIIERCTKYFNDYDVQMLLADNFKGLGKNALAEHYLKTASAMCPSRFMPLYALAKLYEAMGRQGEALALAGKIIDKDEKIPSAMVIAIKNAMSRLIEELEMSDNPENEPLTGSELENGMPRQGEMPMVQPNGAALPP